MIAIRPSALIVASLAFAPAATEAREVGGSTVGLQSFCSGDYARLCDGMDPRGEEVVVCFRRNMQAVSPGCQAAIAEYRASAPTASGAPR